MPIYEFECRACGRKFEELFRSMGEKRTVSCPACKSRKTERQFSLFGMSGGKSSGGGGSCSSCSRGSCAGCRH